MFLAVVNESGYVIRGRQHVNEAYATYHETSLAAGAVITAHSGPNGCEYDLVMPGHPVRWEWLCEKHGMKLMPKAGMKHFWLAPISIRPRKG
jgi:hypothetical protein